MKTECGIYGIIEPPEINVIPAVISGLDLLQHRGRESAGVAYFSEKKIIIHKSIGLVKDVFSSVGESGVSGVSECGEASTAIGHVRYSTSGIKNDSDLSLVQPLCSETDDFPFALAYNGNIKNTERAFEKFNLSHLSHLSTSLFENQIDSHIILEIINYLLNSVYQTFEESLIHFMKNVNGVFCLLIMTEKGIYAMRDSFGVRPLCFGYNKETGGYCIASESCAFMEHFELVREIMPGEILFFERADKKADKKASVICKQLFHLKRSKSQKCIFEYIYFMNKNTRINHKTFQNVFLSIADIRYKIGQEIAIRDIELLYNSDFNIDNALVVGCPLTGIEYGEGYANKTGILYSQFLKKKLDCGRTFILPENKSRIISIKKNLFIDGNIAGRDLILVDDSLVRGNTMTTIIQKLREQGAKSIHIRITAPPVTNPCFFGVDIPTHDELIAASNTIEQIRVKINADTLLYTDIDIIKAAIEGEKYNEYAA